MFCSGRWQSSQQVETMLIARAEFRRRKPRLYGLVLAAGLREAGMAGFGSALW
jgi:hypothetical protein